MPSQLTQAQIDQYHNDGFLLLPSLLDDSDLAPVRDEVDGIVDEVARALFDAGRITDLHENAGFGERLTLLERDQPGTAVMVHVRGILGPALAALWSDERLLDIAEQLIGPRVAGHTVWNLRSKTPSNALTTVPWHQDCAYLGPDSQDTLQVTAWIPLVDATHEMGCLQVIRGGHRQGTFRHVKECSSGGDSRSWYLDIPNSELPAGEVVTCEVPAGGVLLLNQTIPHRSTENNSDQIRWSVDLRWQDPALPTGLEADAEPPILMRNRTNPDFRLDWADWAETSRLDPLTFIDTANNSPWLDRWESAGAAVS
jgi:ectoine hydroxylase-related dioxygenase (phytanoyl-CoA dioxygenase family)